jgi:hypothetical protein
LATVLSEEGHEASPGLKARRIDHGAAVAADADQPSKAEPVERKRQRIGREIKLFGYLTSGHAFRPCLYQQAENIEAVVLRERSQGRNGFGIFYISVNTEIID